ncbi:MAG: hypothetical protein GXP49_06810 [Deltaproteobacteria bacterium]|nr:hypothetical protein [Deltaproteobacteria bacterium]
MKKVVLLFLAALLFQFPGCSSSSKGSPGLFSKTIGPGGGSISCGRVKLVVPPGAIDKQVEFSVHPSLFAPGNHLDKAVELEPSGISLKIPAVLEWSYHEIDLSGVPQTVTPERLQLAFFDTEKKAWQPLWKSTVDTSKETVEAGIGHLSTYSVNYTLPPNGGECNSASHACEPDEPDKGSPDQRSAPPKEPACPFTGTWETCRQGGAPDPPDTWYDFDHEICMQRCQDSSSPCWLCGIAPDPAECRKTCKDFCDNYEMMSRCFNRWFTDTFFTVEIDDNCNVTVTDDYFSECDVGGNKGEFGKAVMNKDEKTWKPTMEQPGDDPGDCPTGSVERFPYYTDDEGNIAALGFEYEFLGPNKCEFCPAPDGYWPGAYTVHWLLKKKPESAPPPVPCMAGFGDHGSPAPDDSQVVSVVIGYIRDSTLTDDQFLALGPDAENNVVFVDGVATFKAKAILFEGNQPVQGSPLESEIKWTVEPDGLFNASFEPHDPSGKGVGPEVEVTITGLPNNIEDFRKLKVRAKIPCTSKCTRCETDVANVDLFFLRDATSHPGQDKTPNWFYYWKQLLNPEVSAVLKYRPNCLQEDGKLRSGYFRPPDKDTGQPHVYICDAAKMWSSVAGGYMASECDLEKTGEFPLVPGTTDLYHFCDTGHEKPIGKLVNGIWHFAETANHEYQHYVNWKELNKVISQHGKNDSCNPGCLDVGKGLYDCQVCTPGDCDGDCLSETSDPDDYNQNIDNDRWSDEHETAYKAGVDWLVANKKRLNELDTSFTFEKPGTCGGAGVMKSDILKNTMECTNFGWPNGKVQNQEHDYREAPY